VAADHSDIHEITAIGHGVSGDWLVGARGGQISDGVSHGNRWEAIRAKDARRFVTRLVHE
jgi:hypothetical protein